MWRWRSPQGKTSAGSWALKHDAKLDAVKAATGKDPDPKHVEILWTSATREGWSLFMAAS